MYSFLHHIIAKSGNQEQHGIQKQDFKLHSEWRKSYFILTNTYTIFWHDFIS